jgi:hypothetical protein
VRGETATRERPIKEPMPMSQRPAPRTKAGSSPPANAPTAAPRRGGQPRPTAKRRSTPVLPAPSDAELELMQAMQAYKISSGRMFPTWSEVLEVLKTLGYAKAV